MTDYTPLLNRLFPPDDGEPPMRHRSAVVDVVNSDGTVDLDFDGTIVSDVAVLDGVTIAASDVVQVAVWRGDLLVLGRARGSIPSASVVTGRASDANPVALSTGFTVVVSATLAIPTNWNTYDIEATGSCVIVDTSGGTTGSNVIDAKFDIAGGGGDLNLVTAWEFALGNDHDTHPFSLSGYREGESMTGTRTVRWLMSRDTGILASADNAVILARAFRVT